MHLNFVQGRSHVKIRLNLDLVHGLYSLPTLFMNTFVTNFQSWFYLIFFYFSYIFLPLSMSFIHVLLYILRYYIYLFDFFSAIVLPFCYLWNQAVCALEEKFKTLSNRDWTRAHHGTNGIWYHFVLCPQNIEIKGEVKLNKNPNRIYYWNLAGNKNTWESQKWKGSL